MLRRLSGWWHLYWFKYWFDEGIETAKEYDLLYSNGVFAPDLVQKREKCARKAHYHRKKCLIRDIDKVKDIVLKDR